jgi:multiple sugar transport system permease protein
VAAVQSKTHSALNRAAVALVVVITLIYLIPIYWITTTAFKPRSLATTVPPTVVFKPELTAFVKLFTKRVQMLGQIDPETYAKAPWWEQRIYDQGERFIKDSNGKIEASGLSEPVLEQSDHRHHQHAARRWRWDESPRMAFRAFACPASRIGCSSS